MSNFMKIVFAFMLSTVLMACDQQGPAEEAGENIDNAMEETGERIEETCDAATDDNC